MEGKVLGQGGKDTIAVATDAGIYAGRILDCDAHLYLEPDDMAELVGDVGAGFVLEFLRKYAGSEQDRQARAQAKADLWGVKGLSAHGAVDAPGRVEAMDGMGLRAQLLFPNTALRELRLETAAARAVCRRYNDYVIDWTHQTGDRARAVCQINMSDVAEAHAELARVLKLGARGVLLSCAAAPGGVSPAHTCWDPFWAMLEEADVPAFLHIASGGVLSTDDHSDPMIPPREFADAEGLKAAFKDRSGAEEALGPFYFVISHMAPEVWLVSMVMGKVFERFPRLRFGVIEVGAGWVGPMCERMDLHSKLMAKVGITYSMPPSEFIRRNVRVTPFWHEDVNLMVERYGLGEVYCFSTDYPHVEGSRDPIGRFRKTINRLGPDYEEAFFCDNGSLLFPNL
ncbi:MAG TPA: amidohydrolase family protein [Alphaproteobacteria bacterium]|jgi:predicted TIM-barrel fold metal-dependent hydrolase|nr:amidohydrolase family protein [Alphaproteobacteria bacterium]